MEQKKNPKADLKRNSGLYFSIGLVLVMALAYIALEWKTYEKPNKDLANFNNIDGIDEVAPPIVEIKLPDPPKPAVTPEVIKIEEDDAEIIETIIESTEPEEEVVYEVNDIAVEKIEEDIPVPFELIEDVPVFPGCEDAGDKKACFETMIKKHINKTFKYPELAQETGTQGKVYTTFVIQKDGTIGEIRMRGPAKILEKEASRIISKLPRMTPGKQRGTAVRVPFSIPITFKLN